MSRLLLLSLFCVLSCAAAVPDNSSDSRPEDTGLFHIDFSRVGYMWGEKPIPDYPVMAELVPPADGADATELIQNAIDKIQTPGTVLLKAGLYNVDGDLKITRSGVVLRGEGEETVLKATGTAQRTLITLGKSTSRVNKIASVITDRLSPAGQMWVRVAKPSLFAPGSRVTVTFKPNDKWIEDLCMDKIMQNSNGSVKQWKAEDYVQSWERTVMRIEDDKVWLDNPLAMDLDAEYASSISLGNTSWDRVEGSGIEDMMMVSDYDSSVVSIIADGKYKGEEYCSDENHAWTAIGVKAAEHCWVRRVKTAYFGYALVNITKGGKNITVQDCVSTEPVSVITGSRRYAFCISNGELCFFERCRAENDRHGFVTGARVLGPNVFVDCEMVHAYSDMGPHHRWATAALYDNCVTDHQLNVQDRAGYGTGHGWAGVNFVFWNCAASSITCQSPWISGKNWCIGCTGTKGKGRSYKDSLVRPDGVWKSHGVRVAPTSLYKTQLTERKERIAD